MVEVWPIGSGPNSPIPMKKKKKRKKVEVCPLGGGPIPAVGNGQNTTKNLLISVDKMSTLKVPKSTLTCRR
jgi:hypothetical protein